MAIISVALFLVATRIILVPFLVASGGTEATEYLADDRVPRREKVNIMNRTVVKEETS